MTTQEQDDLQSLHEEHSRLCAKAVADGIVVPEDLLADFDTADVGRAIVASLEKIVTDTSDAAVPVPNKAKAKSKNKSPTKKAAAVKRATAKKPVPQQQESKVSKTPKKVKKAVAKKATAKRAKRDGSTSAKVIAMLRRKGGATRSQILQVTKWKAISVQQVAKGQGVKLKIDTSKRPFHYMAA